MTVYRLNYKNKWQNLIYEFKQGNKILTRIYKIWDGWKTVYLCECKGLSFEYDDLQKAVHNTHDYIRGLLQIYTDIKKRKYSMIFHCHISQYIERTKYNYIVVDGRSVYDGETTLKTILV